MFGGLVEFPEVRKTTKHLGTQGFDLFSQLHSLGIEVDLRDEQQLAMQEVNCQINHIVVFVFIALISDEFLEFSVMVLTQRFQEEQ